MAIETTTNIHLVRVEEPGFQPKTEGGWKEYFESQGG